MKNKKITITAAVLAVTAIVAFLGIRANTPEQKAIRFVEKNGSMLSELLDSDQPVPETVSVKNFATWDAGHPMDEFTLGSDGSKYYGCYYSPDAVPLAFQNLDVPLTSESDGSWHWEAEGDNNGITKKITDHWYYFEATF